MAYDKKKQQSATRKHFNAICHQIVTKIKIIVDQKTRQFT